jgi:hypothetical protein
MAEEQPRDERADDSGQPPADDPEWRRRRRLAEVFGDALPDTTSDERDEATTSEGPDESPQDRWLRSQVPPHHG